MNGEIIEIILPCVIHTTNKQQTKRVLEELLPSVLLKLYTGNTSDISDYILTKTVRVVNSNTYEIDSDHDAELTGVVNFLESELLPYGLDKNVHDVLRTHKPIRAEFLNSTGVVVKCQRRRDENTRVFPLLMTTV
jgi:hypothetical protein